MTISAPNIASAGNLLAPFGSISLQASTKLTLESGSLTSVSDAGGILIPYGETEGDGQYWYYPLGTAANILSGTPEKTISLNSPDLELLQGAKLNLNGGGDLSAYEFVPAPGGSLDYLSPAYQQSYAVLPGLQAPYAPYDPLATPSSGLYAGENIYLSAAAAGLPAGNYVLLPAIDALLPGAYLITPQAGADNMAAGYSYALANGSPVAAAYFATAGSNVSAGVWQGVEVQSGQAVYNYSPYQLTTASQFFAANTPAGSIPSLPQDAGNLSLIAGQTLNFDANISAAAANGGLGGQMDISATNINIVNQPGAAANGGVTLTASSLNSLSPLNSKNSSGVDSILIGGLRTRSSSGAALSVSAQTVNVGAGVSLSGLEIILAATDSVNVASGASINASGSLSRTDSILTVSNANGASADGALLRVSGAGQAEVIRDSASVDGLNGALNVAAGASLSASGSMLLDATGPSSMQGAIQMSGGALTLNGGLITLGGAAAANAGLQLSDSTLSGLNVKNMILDSSGAINIASALNLQLGNLTLDSGDINSSIGANQTAAITASGGINLQNSGNPGSAVNNSGGGGALQLQAANITLGSGAYALNGFNQIGLNAATALIGSGAGALTGSGNMTVTTPVWTGQAGADTTLNLGAHNLTTLAAIGAQTSSGLAASLNVNAGAIDLNGAIDMAAGNVNLTAAQNLNVHTSAVIDTAGGQAVSLGSEQVGVQGGAIQLSSVNGNLNVQSGATLNVSGSTQGGNAGSVALTAANGAVALDGTLQGFAYQGAAGGNFSLHASSDTAGFSSLNALLQAGGFNGNLAVRLGQGNILVAAADSVQAQNITLTADNGLIQVDGALNV
ncbi:MAG: hypothetical protein ABSB19_01310, partial [Methylomonas sp.]